ncbi:MAG: hypothetical protein L0215_01305 [Gemmataceae bacterium]|nr:hypothetical protein [Gemmataceae bacterium]
MADDTLQFVRRTLETLRETFHGISSRHDRSFCQWVIAEESHKDRLSGQNDREWSKDRRIAGRAFRIREPDLRFVSAEEHQQIIDQRPDAVFSTNSADEPVYYHQPGISSNLNFRGDIASFREFQSVAHDAGFCLVHSLQLHPVALKLPELVPFESIATSKSTASSTNLPENLSERWVAFLHVLGWQNLAFSPLRAERKVWHENTMLLGDAEELHKLMDWIPFARLREHIPLPLRFFASTLLSDLNLSSVYAIDALLAGLFDRPTIDVQRFRQSLAALPPGKEHAKAFHQLALEILVAIFEPDLHSPVPEETIHERRGRIDIVFTNAAERGYFSDLAFLHHIKCPVVFFECKNYSSDVGPSEFAQLISRFSERRSNVGFIVCRKIENKQLAQKRCRDRFQDKQEHILVLDDSDLVELLQLKAEGDAQAVSRSLHCKFRPIFMDV